MEYRAEDMEIIFEHHVCDEDREWLRYDLNRYREMIPEASRNDFDLLWWVGAGHTPFDNPYGLVIGEGTIQETEMPFLHAKFRQREERLMSDIRRLIREKQYSFLIKILSEIAGGLKLALEDKAEDLSYRPPVDGNWFSWD